jgi:hypothetical protein
VAPQVVQTWRPSRSPWPAPYCKWAVGAERCVRAERPGQMCTVKRAWRDHSRLGQQAQPDVGVSGARFITSGVINCASASPASRAAGSLAGRLTAEG